MTSQIIDQYVHSINLVKFKKYILTNGPPLDFSRGGQCPPLNFSRGGQCPPLDLPRGGQCPPLGFFKEGPMPPLEFFKGGQCPPLGGAVYYPDVCCCYFSSSSKLSGDQGTKNPDRPVLAMIKKTEFPVLTGQLSSLVVTHPNLI